MNVDISKAQRRRGRAFLDYGFQAISLLAAVMCLGLLALLLTAIVYQGKHYFSWDFITGLPSRKPEKAGIWPAMIGSIFVCSICAITAIPIGAATAILLEEYQPVRPVLRKIHGFVQLNITNLAGVPSVVYGILGLTVFANVFGLVGNSLTPDYSFGNRFYDEVYDMSGTALRLPADKDNDPIVLEDGMTMLIAETGEPVTINLLSKRPKEPKAGDLRSRARVNRVQEKAWYYIQLPLGRGVLAGGLTLMLVVLPIIIISSQEALRAVPGSLRQGALALGATKWQTVWSISLPSAIPGIMTGSILAISRALGEAAPLLILAGIVYITFTPANLMDSFSAMPLQIFNWASRPQEAFHEVAASGIILLMAILLSFNSIAVIIRQKYQRNF